jgi:hypothetical protein
MWIGLHQRNPYTKVEFDTTLQGATIGGGLKSFHFYLILRKLSGYMSWIAAPKST